MWAHDGVRIGLTPGDPRGIGPEVLAGALRRLRGCGTPPVTGEVEYVVIGPELSILRDLDTHPGITFEPTGGSAETDAAAGRASIEAVERGIVLAIDGAIDGLVTGPISKQAVAAAGCMYPGHTELLRERTGVEDVTMIMGAEKTPLGGPLRIALLTVHVPLRSVSELLTEALVRRRASIAAAALRDWWGIPRPRLAFAGVNPHASEGGLFGDEEARVLAPAMRRLDEESGIEIVGLFPADSVFRRCIEGEADLVVAPAHDVGLAVLKTVAPHCGINVTAGLPFPRTSPDHGTAFDIAGLGVADPGSMVAAIETCTAFCSRAAHDAGGDPPA
ncbi:MAG: PdxA family protein [Gemmatimonadota bacterium]